jgi:hypothetical protein
VSASSIDLGLVSVSTERLELLLKALHRETIVCPLTPAGLAGHGLQDDTSALLGHMRGLDRAGVHAVVVAVLAERMAADARAKTHARA